MPEKKTDWLDVTTKKATIFGYPVTLRDLFLPSVVKRRKPDYEPNSKDVLVATVKPFIYFRDDGKIFWCEGGEIEMRNLRLDVVEDVDPDRIKVQGNVETRLRLLGERPEQVPREDVEE